MYTKSPEEIWFGRVVYVFGVKELLDVALNAATLLKLRSGLHLAVGAEERTTIAYLICSAVIAAYILLGGSLFSWIAYRRPIRRNDLMSDTPFPDGIGWLSVTLRAFGVYQLLRAAGTIALICVYHDFLSERDGLGAPKMSAVYTAWTLEYIIIGSFFIVLGGSVASRLLKGRNAQPGATDNPDDAQRLREEH